jgi:DMSO/TMAO reductase YedYZ molybdopterin-dependent catalytic subunit
MTVPFDRSVESFYSRIVLSDESYILCQEDQEERSVFDLAPAAVLAAEPEIRPAPLAALAFEDPPSDLHFVRSHFAVPTLDTANWKLKVDGAVAHDCSYSLAELRQRPVQMQTVVLECAGHRRNEFRPKAPGLQWGVGAVSTSDWAGVTLRDLLGEVSPSDRACEVVFEGADRGPHRSSNSDVVFARSISLERALAGDVLLAWEMNGEPIPVIHGAPLRAIVPGSYGVASVKWVCRISLLEQPFAGPFQVDDYQLNGKPLEDLRVNSLIVHPADGTVLPAGATAVSGVAWGGQHGIAAVEVRVSDGPWHTAMLRHPAKPTSFHRWSAVLALPPGAHRLEARARDCSGVFQPEEAEWNPLGYANNSVPAVHVRCILAPR